MSPLLFFGLQYPSFVLTPQLYHNPWRLPFAWKNSLDVQNLRSVALDEEKERGPNQIMVKVKCQFSVFLLRLKMICASSPSLPHPSPLFFVVDLLKTVRLLPVKINTVGLKWGIKNYSLNQTGLLSCVKKNKSKFSWSHCCLCSDLLCL